MMALKWYTRARKFPQLIGRTPDGARIPGGPYTYTQIAAGAGTAIVLAQTTWLWAHGSSLLVNAAIYIGATLGAVFAAGKLPPGMRNPFVLATGALNLLSAGYRVDGSAIPTPKPCASTSAGPVTIFETSPQTQPEPPTGEPSGSEEQDEVEPPPLTSPAALTSVQRILLGEAS